MNLDGGKGANSIHLRRNGAIYCKSPLSFTKYLGKSPWKRTW